MSATNTINVIGRVGGPVQTRQVGERTVAKFSVAVNRPTKDKDTDWFNVEVWGKAAEAAEKMIDKGSLVAVSGSMNSRKHEGKEYWTLNANDWQFVGSKPADKDGMDF